MKQYLIFITGFVLVFLALLFYAPLANDFPYSNGKALLAFYIPLPVVIGLTLYFFLYKQWNWRVMGVMIGLFLLWLLPFASMWGQTYQYLPQDDGYRYHIMAQHIAETNRLWGADDLVFGTDHKVYLFQPGYRYYVAGWIKIMGAENRLFQCWNMLLYLMALLVFLSGFRKQYSGTRIEKGFLLFILLSSPFVVKLILMGLSEWLLISLCLLAAGALLRKKTNWAVVALALIPFVRQNLVLTSLLLMIWLWFQQRITIKSILLYVLILMLPLYHNLYYADTWKWLSTYPSSYGYLTLYPADSVLLQWVKTIGVKLMAYSGVHLLQGFQSGVLIALLFIPLGTMLYVLMWRTLKQGDRLWFGIISLAAILPTLVLGGQSYYPRFEWVNLYTAALVFVLIRSKHLFAQQEGIGLRQTT